MSAWPRVGVTGTLGSSQIQDTLNGESEEEKDRDDPGSGLGIRVHGEAIY